jgi:hypothetical protein
MKNYIANGISLPNDVTHSLTYIAQNKATGTPPARTSAASSSGALTSAENTAPQALQLKKQTNTRLTGFSGLPYVPSFLLFCDLTICANSCTP